MIEKNKRHVDENVLAKARDSRCAACGKYGCDPDHLVTKGSGGGDLDHNIMPVCRRHHAEKGQIGMIAMSEKYPRYKNWLISHGWYICEVRNKWVNDLNNI